MAYDEGLAQRLHEIFASRDDGVENKMFGGIGFMVSGNMCCGVVKDRLMARVGPDAYETAVDRDFASPMDFTGRPMNGFLFVEPPGIESDTALEDWVILCLAFVDSLPPK